MGGRLGSGESEQKGKRTRGHGQQCGDCWGKGGTRGLNGNGKNTIKIKFKKMCRVISLSYLNSVFYGTQMTYLYKTADLQILWWLISI